MNREMLNERFFEVLITGDRPAARKLVAEAETAGWSPQQLITELYWPTYENLDKLHRADQLAALAHHMATRLLRVIVDQTTCKMTPEAPIGRRIMCFCGPSESEELGAQMAVDLLEASGFDVSFAGGGIANDEILGQVQQEKPDVLLMFASAPGDLPNIRALIDTLREIGACDGLQFAVGAGVFNRAEGLAEEIGADLWATDPLEMVERLVSEPARRASDVQRTVGKNRKIRKAA